MRNASEEITAQLEWFMFCLCVTTVRNLRIAYKGRYMYKGTIYPSYSIIYRAES